MNSRWDGWVGLACSPGAYVGQGEADNTQANKHKNQITKCVLRRVSDVQSVLGVFGILSVLAFLNSQKCSNSIQNLVREC